MVNDGRVLGARYDDACIQLTQDCVVDSKSPSQCVCVASANQTRAVAAESREVAADDERQPWRDRCSSLAVANDRSRFHTRRYARSAFRCWAMESVELTSRSGLGAFFRSDYDMLR